MASEEILDSPIGWVANHIRTYVDSGGRKGPPAVGRPHAAANHPRPQVGHAAPYGAHLPPGR
jgi:hypothetical protein